MSEDEKSLAKRGLYDTKYIAKLWNLSERRIQQLAQSKIIPSEKIKGMNYYPLIDAWRKYTYYLQDIVNNKINNEEELEREKLLAEISLKQAKAETAQLDLLTAKADLLIAEDVRDYIEDLCANIKSMLSALPGRLAMDLMNVKNPVECSKIIDSAISEVLEDLSKYKFSRKYYQEKVSEQNNRREDEDENEV